MSAKQVSGRIQLKRDTSANWTSYDPVLLEGEMVIVDTANGRRTKTGDGVKTFTKLPFDDEAIYNALGDKADKSTLTSVETQLSQL